MNIRRETHEGTDFRFGPYRQYFGDLSVGVFDIETTGLNPKNAKLILAGLLVPQGDSFVLTQYFAEYPEEEALVLAALVEDLCKLDVVITYNGLAFDL
ncbi:MAG: ribonuclease H-like domain-containing protein, partial [Anaerovoracaceae bacterium]